MGTTKSTQFPLSSSARPPSRHPTCIGLSPRTQDYPPPRRRRSQLKGQNGAEPLQRPQSRSTPSLPASGLSIGDQFSITTITDRMKSGKTWHREDYNEIAKVIHSHGTLCPTMRLHVTHRNQAIESRSHLTGMHP